MALLDNFAKLVGEWKGSNRLHSSWTPENPIRDSESNAVVKSIANGKFLEIAYDWVFEGERQEGVIILGKEAKTEKATMGWVDSWHQSNEVLHCRGEVLADGSIKVKGYFPVHEGPDWGWITVFETENENSFKFTMYNVTPEGEETVGVEAAFARK